MVTHTARMRHISHSILAHFEQFCRQKALPPRLYIRYIDLELPLPLEHPLPRTLGPGIWDWTDKSADSELWRTKENLITLTPATSTVWADTYNIN